MVTQYSQQMLCFTRRSSQHSQSVMLLQLSQRIEICVSANMTAGIYFVVDETISPHGPFSSCSKAFRSVNAMPVVNES